MTATLSSPTPGQLAANVAKFRNAAPAGRAPTALDLVDHGDPRALALARFVECTAGRHVWVKTPIRTVCRHCPMPKDQAAKVRAASTALHATTAR